MAGNADVMVATQIEKALLHQEHLERLAMLIYSSLFVIVVLVSVFLRYTFQSEDVYDSHQLSRLLAGSGIGSKLLQSGIDQANLIAPSSYTLFILCLFIAIEIIWDIFSPRH
ncbi:hypothetical protein CYMTET_27254 [Cymbomonas tetramitiformis]|uniref:Uncharacterized protein n=1 Tax=Cymbomonas tetramitiformis TaxID=36881 RepID=A0AAE0KXE5_9CHLO|nr:hypothetical protein CYMTET_27254 [Cymbomonas tetramitiformis]